MSHYARICCLFALLWLAACATEQNYQLMLKGWLGASEQDLINGWGIPDKTYDTKTSRFVAYYHHYTRVDPGFEPSYHTVVVDAHTAYAMPMGGIPPSVRDMICETTFELHKGRVVSWNYRGNNCVAERAQ